MARLMDSYWWLYCTPCHPLHSTFKNK